MKISKLFKTKKVTAIFAVVALLGGFYFLNNTLTGNVIVESENSINLISVIGLLLIFCSIILGAYSIKKK
ncbi:MAG: hypothetical protein WC584_03370 [Candidatus Pacearchaeota archaeon]